MNTRSPARLRADDRPTRQARRRDRRSGFSLIELLVSLTIIGILAIGGVALLVGARYKAWDSACDDNQFKLVQTMANSMDTRIDAGNLDAAKESVIEGVTNHSNFVNPFNQQIPAYILTDDSDPACDGSFVPAAGTKCQVAWCYDGVDTIVAHQFWPDVPRSFRIVVD